MQAGNTAADGPRFDDARFMALALTLGRRGLGRTWPNPAVGAVLVKDGTIVGRGWTQPGGRPHAETEALARAGAAAQGATLYVTLEPCSHHGKTPPCADAVLAAGVARVVTALEDPNPEVAGEGHRRLQDHGIAVTVGVGAEEARRDHAGHIRRMHEGRPHVTLKLAVSADGKAGLAGRRPAAITGPQTQARVHFLRATSDAIITGIGTVMADDPQLTCRLPGMSGRAPIAVVLDGDLRLPPTSRLAAGARSRPVWVVASPDGNAGPEQALRDKGVEIIRDHTSDLVDVLELLGRRGLTRVLVEAGPILASAFLRADLVDEAVIIEGPNAIGPDGIDALESDARSAFEHALVRIGEEDWGSDHMRHFARR